MANRVKRPLKVYISKSYLLEDDDIFPVREILKKKGFIVTESFKGTFYNPNLLKECDFVLFLTTDGCPKKAFPWTKGVTKYISKVGKGQYGEAKKILNEKEAFLLHYNADNILFGSKLQNLNILDLNSYRKDYGELYSYVKGEYPIDVYNYITGYFSSEHQITHSIKIEEEKSSFNRKLLFLIK